MRTRAIVLITSFVAGISPIVGAEPANKPAAKRLDWLSGMKLGVAIRWDLSLATATAEPLSADQRVGTDDQSRLQRFRLDRFDAKAWVALAKRAGAQYVTITTKGPDGFCLFDSKATSYGVAATPFGRDIVAELTKECREQGLRVCFSYSLVDTHHESYTPATDNGSAAAPADFGKYMAYVQSQLRELCGNYGTVDALWLEGQDKHPGAAKQIAQALALARQLQPQLVVNDGVQVPRDLQTRPSSHPPAEGERPAIWQRELAFGPANSSSGDRAPLAGTICTLVDVVSRGGSLLLGLQPLSDGAVPAEIEQQLTALGEWMFKNKAAIYDTTASPFWKLPFHGRVTVRDNRLYVIVFLWPTDGTLRLPGLTSLPKSARLLVGGRNLTANSSGRDILISGLSASAPDPIASVVVVDLASPPKVAPLVLQPDKSGLLDLPILFADIAKEEACPGRFAMSDGVVHLNQWKGGRIEWEIELLAPGTYDAKLVSACGASAGATIIRSCAGKQAIRAGLRFRGKPNQFSEVPVGTLNLTAGRQTVAVSGTVPANASIAVRSLRLERRTTEGAK